MINFIKEQFSKKGYKFYDVESTYKLNIIVVRSAYREEEVYADYIYLVYKDFKNDWRIHQWQVTADVQTYFNKDDTKYSGSVLLAPGQYASSYEVKEHYYDEKAKYPALCQTGTVNAFIDGELKNGHFGCDIVGKQYKNIKWKSPTIMFSYIEFFKDFMKIVQQAKQIHGSKFTVTVFDEEDFDINNRFNVTRDISK